MAQQQARVSPAELEKHLRGITYPAKKNDLVEKARENGASDEIVRALEDLPAEQFGGPQDVTKAYGAE
jgi:hypothetical protein